jgi:hypothetical protein
MVNLQLGTPKAWPGRTPARKPRAQPVDNPHDDPDDADHTVLTRDLTWSAKGVTGIT